MEYRIGKIYNKKIEKCSHTGEVVLTSYIEKIDVEKISARLNSGSAFDFDAEISRLENMDYSLYKEDAEEVRSKCMALIEKYKKEKKDRYIKNKKRSINRAIGKLFRYTELNAFQYKDSNGYVIKPCMVTLTFSENTQDFKYTNKAFTNYIKRLNYYVYGYKCSNLRYVAVPELQDRGAIHFHILFFNLPFINFKDQRVLNEWNALWTEGKCPDLSCNGDLPDNAEGIAKYITKYMTKQFYFDVDSSSSKSFCYDPDLWEDKKIYFASRNLIKPDVYKITDTEFDDIVFLFDGVPMESKDIICSYEDATGNIVDKVIGSSFKVILGPEKMKVLDNYLSSLHEFQIVDYDYNF